MQRDEDIEIALRRLVRGDLHDQRNQGLGETVCLRRAVAAALALALVVLMLHIVSLTV